MALLEALTLQVGPAIAKAILKFWLKDRKVASDTVSSLVDLIRSKTADVLAQRRSSRQFEGIGEKVAESLYQFLRWRESVSMKVPVPQLHWQWHLTLANQAANQRPVIKRSKASRGTGTNASPAAAFTPSRARQKSRRITATQPPKVGAAWRYHAVACTGV
jgi:hypothetical protein